MAPGPSQSAHAMRIGARVSQRSRPVPATSVSGRRVARFHPTFDFFQLSARDQPAATKQLRRIHRPADFGKHRVFAQGKQRPWTIGFGPRPTETRPRPAGRATGFRGQRVVDRDQHLPRMSFAGGLMAPIVSADRRGDWRRCRSGASVPPVRIRAWPGTSVASSVISTGNGGSGPSASCGRAPWPRATCQCDGLTGSIDDDVLQIGYDPRRHPVAGQIRAGPCRRVATPEPGDRVDRMCSRWPRDSRRRGSGQRLLPNPRATMWSCAPQSDNAPPGRLRTRRELLRDARLGSDGPRRRSSKDFQKAGQNTLLRFHPGLPFH